MDDANTAREIADAERAIKESSELLESLEQSEEYVRLRIASLKAYLAEQKQQLTEDRGPDTTQKP